MTIFGVRNFFNGVGIGELYVRCYHEELELRQNGSKVGRVLAAGLQVMQGFSFYEILSPLIHSLSRKQPYIRALSQIAFLGSTLLFLGLKGVRLGIIPQRIFSSRFVSLIYFASRHSSKVVYAATLVSSLALIVFGHPFLGSGAGAIFLYNLVSSRLPERIQFFVNGCLPILGVLASCIGGGGFSCVVYIGSLFNCSSRVNRWLSVRIDLLGRRILDIPGIPLQESNAPLLPNQEPSYREIQDVLFHPDRLIFDPAHYTKFPKRLALPEQRRFAHFLTLYDGIRWADRMEGVRKRLRTDDRFIDYLAEECHVNAKHVKRRFDHYLSILAQRKRITPQQLLLHWMRAQMKLLIDHLYGRVRMVGKVSDIQEARTNAAYILSYLQQPHIPREDLEKMMLELVIGAGGYCPCKIVATTRNLMAQIHAIAGGDPNPQRDYERRVKQHLLNLRRQIKKQFYERDWGELKNVANDVHVYNFSKIGYSLGFEPLTAAEKNDLTLAELFSWWFSYAKQQEKMRDVYRERLQEAFQQDQPEDLAEYLQIQIERNLNLTAEQKQQLIHQLRAPDSDFWRNLNDELPFFWQEGGDGVNGLNGAQRFLLFTLGILRFR